MQAFYINLSGRLDRRAHVEAELARLGIAAERIEAITPPELPANIAGRFASGPKPRLSPVECACNHSHRKAWQAMLDRGLDHALILEDDVVLSVRLPLLLAEPRLMDGVDALQFEIYDQRTILLGPAVPVGVPGIVRHRLMASSLGTSCYVMTAALARQLLAGDWTTSTVVDELVFGRRGGTIYSHRMFQVVPALCVQLDRFDPLSATGKSDLQAGRAAARAGVRRRVFGARMDKLKVNFGHILRTLRAFVPTGELFGARQVGVWPIADLRARIGDG